MSQEMDDVLRSGDNTSYGREGFRERRENEIDVIVQPKVAHASSAIVAEDAECVGFVDEYGRLVLLGDLYELWEVDDAAFHREDAVRNDELPRVGRRARELPAESIEVAVGVAMDLAHPEPRGVDERRMIEAIEEDVIIAAKQRGECAEARLVACREDEG